MSIDEGGLMMGTRKQRRVLLAVLVASGMALLAPAVGAAATLHTTLLAKAGYGSTPVGFARTADGVLHVVVDQNTNWQDSYNGIAAVSISPSGHVGPAVQALNWNGCCAQGIPGLTVLPSGALETTWGGYPFGSDGPWGISSTNGGAAWSSPANIGSGSMEFGDSHVDVAVSSGTPVLAAGCCGGIVIQKGFGAGAPTYQLTNNTDGCAGNTDLGTDAATGAVIASWDSCDGSGGQWLQEVAPSEGTAVKLAVPRQYGSGVTAIVTGRDAGPGVFAAYPANYANTTHMRLQRYGGGSVSVGSARHLHANVWGIAPSSDGRLWVMWWGQNTKTGKLELAVTRSNKAVTRFEPIQLYGYTFNLGVLQGDGRLGPLDMLSIGTPYGASWSGIFHARILPELSASIHAVNLGGGKFKLKVDVSDAGDPVKGATVSADGKSQATNTSGKAKLTLSGSSGHRVTVHISAPGYRPLTATVTL